MTKSCSKKVILSASFIVIHINTRLAEAAALRQLRPQWGVNLGGGREWFHVPQNQWNNFLVAFQANNYLIADFLTVHQHSPGTAEWLAKMFSYAVTV